MMVLVREGGGGLPQASLIHIKSEKQEQTDRGFKLTPLTKVTVSVYLLQL